MTKCLTCVTDCGYSMLRRSPDVQHEQCLNVCSTSCDVSRVSKRPAVMNRLRSTRRHTVRKNCTGKIWTQKCRVQKRRGEQKLLCTAEYCANLDEADSNFTDASCVASIDVLPSGSADSTQLVDADLCSVDVSKCEHHTACSSAESMCKCRGKCTFLHDSPSECVYCKCAYDLCADVTAEYLCKVHDVTVPENCVCGECWLQDKYDRECARKYNCKGHEECSDNPQICKCRGYCDPFMDYTNICLRCECVHTPPGGPISDSSDRTDVNSRTCDVHNYVIPEGQMCDGCHDVKKCRQKERE